MVHTRTRILLTILTDGVLAAAALPVARWVSDPTADPFQPLWLVGVSAAAVLLAGIPVGLARQFWRFAGVRELLGVGAAAIGGALLFALFCTLSGAFVYGGAALLVAHALVLLVFLGGPRVFYRLRSIRRRQQDEVADSQSLLLVGAGDGADLFLRALEQERGRAYRVCGILSLRQHHAGRSLHGHRILGTLDDAETVLEDMRAAGTLPAQIAVTNHDVTGPALAQLMQIAERFGVAVRRAGDPMQLTPTGQPGSVELRPVVIEDLLNRPQVALDREGMARLVQGRRVLVTGAGGTIGSELARQVAALGPETLLLLDNGEFALWQIDMELAEHHPHVARTPLIADVRDEARMRALMQEFRPELVFHAAALKHVPMVESNPLEGLLTNACGTRVTADAARAAGAMLMVLISTDKAVNPTSVMGASKRLAEMYCQGLDIQAREQGTGMRCVTVRFGNVLGSTGSVVPLFQRQLARGGPLTVTHPDMQRYFMTVREAVSLVLQASVVGAGEDKTSGDGGIFVLDMGKPVKIVDLARQMIRLAGLRPDYDVEIRFTGLRPGEKLFEELFHGKEPPAPTAYPGLLMAKPRTADPAIIGRALDEMAAYCHSGAKAQAQAALGRLVPEFEHNADGSVAHG